MTTARFDGAREVPSVTSNGVRCVTEKVVAVGPRTLFGGSVVTDAREIIAQTLGHHPGWSRTADAILAALTAAGFRVVGPGEVDAETVEKCALAAQAAIESEAYDLSDIRNSYIEARKTGRHSGRRISDDLAKSFAGKFAERSDAVYLVAEIATTRIRALKETQR